MMATTRLSRNPFKPTPRYYDIEDELLNSSPKQDLANVHFLFEEEEECLSEFSNPFLPPSSTTAFSKLTTSNTLNSFSSSSQKNHSIHNNPIKNSVQQYDRTINSSNHLQSYTTAASVKSSFKMPTTAEEMMLYRQNVLDCSL
eukprot:TRINITY_DN1108_c0_g1_i2.p1 TRINITY_DN1108_c0_g1~~TRINITY_DN1108_c0_g1_i2.p1  ORF type:complete len:143 (-),score=34.32 TRINITY_DN1108_c0_g1_i2:91-519(-)